MANFPALEPKNRHYSLGDYSITERETYNAPPVLFRHSSSATGHVMTLAYEDLTESDMLLIRTHYRGQNGSYRSFQLPATVWAGHSDTQDIVSSASYWRYSAEPEEIQKGLYYDVSVELLLVTP